MDDLTLDFDNCPFHKNRIYDHDIAVADLLTCNALRRYGKWGQVVGINVREARAAKVNEARTLLASTPQLNTEGQAKFDKLKSEITELEAQEQRAVFIEDMERKSLGTPVDKSEAARQPRGQARPRPTPLPSRLTEAEVSAHAELIARMGDKAIWLRYSSNG
mgnify:CR=1 FL=1